MGTEGGGWGREAGGEVACEEEREGGRRYIGIHTYLSQYLRMCACVLRVRV